MERGVEMEPQATAWFEVETGLVVTPIGFVSSDNNLIGASPDGMVCHPDDIAAPMIPLELKCPKPSTHIRWLLDGGVPKDHIAQCHFQMVLCESDYMWFSSYSPDIAPLIVKVKWSEYTDTMVKAIESYTKEYHRSVEMLEEL
jgi:hypothetical protein